MAASPPSVAGSGAEPAASCSAKLRGILTWGSDRTPSQIKAPAPASGGFKLSPAWQHPVPVDFREFERGALQFRRPRHWWKGVIRTARRQRHLVPLQCGHVGEQRHEAARRQTIGDAPGFGISSNFARSCWRPKWPVGATRRMPVMMKVTWCGLKNEGEAYPYPARSWFRQASVDGDTCWHRGVQFGGKTASLCDRTSTLRCMMDNNCLEICYAGMEAGHCRWAYVMHPFKIRFAERNVL